MRILLISSAFSGLTQRFYTELEDAGYIVSVELHQGDVAAIAGRRNVIQAGFDPVPFFNKASS